MEYLDTVGNPEAPLPDFLAKNVLKTSSTGEVEYDLRPESFMSTPEIFVAEVDANAQPVTSTPVKAKKQVSVKTRQKGRRRKNLDDINT